MRIKICGITNAEDGRLASSLGADAVGLNFYPPSPRSVREEQAALIVQSLPPFVTPVALFVNESWESMARILDRLRFIKTVQWHGERHEPIPASWPYRVIAAFAVRSADSLLQVREYLGRCEKAGRLPDALLLDGHAPGVYGGTGQPAPWKLLADFQAQVPIILAGGLTPDNVAQAVSIVKPWAVDVASGVESSPGKKDADKMRRFITAAREARLLDLL